MGRTGIWLTLLGMGMLTGCTPKSPEVVAQAPAQRAAPPQITPLTTLTLDPNLASVVQRVIDKSSFDLPVRAHPSVVRTVAYIQTQPQARAIMEASLQNAGRYKSQVIDVLARDHLPADLFYVAQAESAFLSPALKGKGQLLGLWQFIPSTARHYGLRVDGGVDDRTDVFKCTDAATRLLLDLQHTFNDWALTVTGYNAGAAILERAMEVAGSRDVWTVIETPDALPEESRSYLPLVYAHAIISRDPAAFGFTSKVDTTTRQDLETSWDRYYSIRYAPVSLLGLTPSTGKLP